jgi:hypothetical protein
VDTALDLLGERLYIGSQELPKEVLGPPINEPELAPEGPGPAKEPAAEQARRFTEWFERMKGLYEGLWEQHEDLDVVRLKMPKRNFVFKRLPPHVAKALGTNAESLFISPNNMAKQFRNHLELAPGEYYGVFGKMKDCTEIYENGDTRIALILKDGAWYRLIPKTTKDLREAYFVSLHRLSVKSLKKIRRKSKPIH